MNDMDGEQLSSTTRVKTKYKGQVNITEIDTVYLELIHNAS